jgi:hypothetical protein
MGSDSNGEQIIIGPNGEQLYFKPFDDTDSNLAPLYGSFGFSWDSVDLENPIYIAYLVDENFERTEYYATWITYDENFRHWLFVDSDLAYCELV